MYHLAICVQHSRLEPLLDQPEQTAVDDSQAEQLNQSIVTDVVKETRDVSLDLEVVPSELKLHGQFINCVVCSFLRPIPITTAQEILLVDGLQYSSDRKLQQLVFYYWYPERSKSTVRFGYRPKKGAHDAVDKLTVKLQFGRYNFEVEADIKGFFDNIGHDRLIELLSLRIADRSLLWLIKKWLKAGVLDTDGKVIHPATG